MQIVKNYDVVFGNGAKDFKKAVNDAITNGWQPFGGVSTTMASIPQANSTVLSVLYSQAMVKV